MPQLTVEQFAKLFDHTLLKADARRAGFEQLCAEAREHGFAMVAINPGPVALCRELLAGSDVRVGAAIAFPLGQNTVAQKVAETAASIDDGAQEIDYVVNQTALKDGDLALVEREMREIVELCRARGVLSKVIFENCYLTDDEKRSLAGIAKDVEPDFIKTSTGFGTGGATFADVELMRSAVGDKVQIKAAGGLRTLDDVLRYLDLGVTRVGSSASIAILSEYRTMVGAR
ncbi:deoxyribose-phosphate aldolase [Luteococcus peritonei]|uniref:Deoxyribose-phosphate aldolase n=1 Tax=Luteococcus peritonei TaxID=88874 RepID=A0ABW4RWG4_9ACTN